jgi:hypothetical protein
VSKHCTLLCCTILAAWSLAGDIGRAEGPRIVRCELGFDNLYRLGNWVPLRCTVDGGDQPAAVVISAIAPDSDGLGVEYSTPAEKPTGILPGRETTVELLVRIGQSDASIEVSMAGSNVSTRQRVVLSPYQPLDNRGILGGLPATTRHILEISANASGTADALELEQSGSLGSTRVSAISDFSKLPLDSLAYESIDTIVLATAGDCPLVTTRPSDARLLALRQWVQQGGRLVISVAEHADTLFAGDGALRDFVDADISRTITIDNPTPLEEFATSRSPIGPRGATQLPIAQIDRISGQIIAFAGEQPNSVPLVVSQHVGLGRVTLLACDLNTQPLRGWKDRPRLIRKLVDGNADRPATSDQSNNYYYGDANDLSDQLRSKLDSQLQSSGIRTLPFLAIALLVFGYILLIGPFDYWLVKHVLKRMEATWITFPLIVLGTCAGAYWLADYLKGDEQVVNQIEVVDFDQSSGFYRGTLWHHVFSPQPQRYNLALAAVDPAGSAIEPASQNLAWLGQTGNGLGRMGATAAPTLPSRSYSIPGDRHKMIDRPIQVWSTRTSVARWHGTADPLSSSNLSRSSSRRLAGTITNNSAVNLQNVRVVYDGWVWSLPNWSAGQTVRVDSLNDPVRIKTLVNKQFGMGADEVNAYQLQRNAANLSIDQLVWLMLMAEVADAEKLSAHLNRYQHFIDLSHLADEQTAIVIATVDSRRSQLLNRDKPLSNSQEKAGLSLVFYRVILPVAAEGQTP